MVYIYGMAGGAKPPRSAAILASSIYDWKTYTSSENLGHGCSNQALSIIRISDANAKVAEGESSIRERNFYLSFARAEPENNALAGSGGRQEGCVPRPVPGLLLPSTVPSPASRPGESKRPRLGAASPPSRPSATPFAPRDSVGGHLFELSHCSLSFNLIWFLH